LSKSDGAPADGTKVRLKSKETARLADIRTEKAVARTGNDGIVVTAKVTYDATKLADVNARAAGVVRELKVEVGARVKQGAALAVIESAQVGADRSKLAAASARVKVAEENLAREKQLHDEKISSRKSLLEAQQELEAARADQAAIASGLAIVGGAGAGGRYTLTAPIDGTVTVRKATIGKLVDPEEALFQVVDTALMWAELDVPEKELARVHAGQAVALTLDAVEGDIAGTLDYLAPAVDPHTRTAKGRVRLENRRGDLRANMYGRARVVLPSGQAGVLVPRSAVQRAKDVSLVFVRLSDEQYEARRVQTGGSDDERIEVTRGVKPGEDVVTQGSFLLKTETLKDSIGAGCCD
jgi:cobalt-zinc-cadmium efflux system membrane fusion protein